MNTARILNQLYRTAASPTRCAVLAPILFAVIGFSGATEVKAQIREYPNHVFTNNGQSTVAGFQAKLTPAASHALNSVTGLEVYVGHHGDASGTACGDFNALEQSGVRTMAGHFPRATLIWLSSAVLQNTRRPLTNAQILMAVRGGNVFFTWCDSDTRVKNVIRDAAASEEAAAVTAAADAKKAAEEAAAEKANKAVAAAAAEKGAAEEAAAKITAPEKRKEAETAAAAKARVAVEAAAREKAAAVAAAANEETAAVAAAARAKAATLGLIVMTQEFPYP